MPLRLPVLEGDFGVHGVVGGERAGSRNVRDCRFAVFEGRVAEALAERERWILREIGITIAVLATDLVVIDRQLARMTREGDRQTSARLGLA